MLFNTLNLIYLNVTMPNLTRKIFTQISLAGLYLHVAEYHSIGVWTGSDLSMNVKSSIGLGVLVN